MRADDGVTLTLAQRCANVGCHVAMVVDELTQARLADA